MASNQRTNELTNGSLNGRRFREPAKGSGVANSEKGNVMGCDKRALGVSVD